LVTKNLAHILADEVAFNGADIATILSKIQNGTYGLSALNTDLDKLLTGIIQGTGTVLPANKSLYDFISTMQLMTKFPSPAITDEINTTTTTYTTEEPITVALPSGASIVRAMLAVFITAMNASANTQKIDIMVEGRVAGGTWYSYFLQLDCLGLPNVDGATTGFVPLNNVSNIVTGGGTYEFRVAITQSSANSVRYTTQYLLIITYKMS